MSFIIFEDTKTSIIFNILRISSTKDIKNLILLERVTLISIKTCFVFSYFFYKTRKNAIKP